MKPYEAYLNLVEEALVPQLDALGDIPAKLREAMCYSLSAGGKRLRPVLLLAVCDLMAGDLNAALPYACALEMIHTYSLIHDDLPAMDNDDLRRGKPSCHVAYGEDLAILAGDGLLSAAAELLTASALRCADHRGIRAAHCILSRAGVTGMVAGQTVDVTEEGCPPTRERVTYIHRHKTADLLTAPMEAGVILGGGDEREISAAVAYGQHLGIAFQMVDDLLDLLGDEKILGKRTGQDAANGKQTWVAVRGVAGTREDAAAEAEAAVRAIRETGRDCEFFVNLAYSTLNRIS